MALVASKVPFSEKHIDEASILNTFNINPSVATYRVDWKDL